MRCVGEQVKGVGGDQRRKRSVLQCGAYGKLVSAGFNSPVALILPHPAPHTPAATSNPNPHTQPHTTTTPHTHTPCRPTCAGSLMRANMRLKVSREMYREMSPPVPPPVLPPVLPPGVLPPPVLPPACAHRNGAEGRWTLAPWANQAGQGAWPVLAPLCMPFLWVPVHTVIRSIHHSPLPVHVPNAAWQPVPQWSAVVPHQPKRLQQVPEPQRATFAPH